VKAQYWGAAGATYKPENGDCYAEFGLKNNKKGRSWSKYIKCMFKKVIYKHYACSRG
jgi:hypothetical protein